MSHPPKKKKKKKTMIFLEVASILLLIVVCWIIFNTVKFCYSSHYKYNTDEDFTLCPRQLFVIVTALCAVFSGFIYSRASCSRTTARGLSLFTSVLAILTTLFLFAYTEFQKYFLRIHFDRQITSSSKESVPGMTTYEALLGAMPFFPTWFS